RLFIWNDHRMSARYINVLSEPNVVRQFVQAHSLGQFRISVLYVVQKTARGFPLLIASNVRCRPKASWQLFPQLEQSRNQVFNRWSERLTELINLVTAVLRETLHERLPAFSLLRRRTRARPGRVHVLDTGAMRQFVSQ